MNNIIIVGAGGHAAELKDYIEFINQNSSKSHLNIIGYIDDDKNSYDSYNYTKPYLGSINSHLVDKTMQYLIAIANIEHRKSIIEKLISQEAIIRGLVHPTALISPSATIDPTVIISHSVSVGPNVKISAYNLLNSRCTIGHGSNIGINNIISPQVVISGNTKIKNHNLIGSSAITLPGIEIGSNNIIAAGAVLNKNINDGVIVAGAKLRFYDKK